VKCKVNSLIENKDKIVRCKWDTLTKHVGCRIVICDLPQFGMKKGGGIHCQGLCPFDKDVIVGPMGSKFYLATSQETFERGELENNPIQIHVSFFFSWLPYVRI
jgi:hypothetical protein